jgi:hypothetical protein
LNGSFKKEASNLKNLLKEVGEVTLKIINLKKLAALSFLKTSSSVSKHQTVLKKPLSAKEAAFFPQFISAQHALSRTPMNGSLICSSKSSDLLGRNGWVFLNCSSY